MKPFLLSLLILLAATAGAMAQNYQPIYSNSLQVFYQEELMHYWGEEDWSYNMWGTRIDSVSTTPQGDSIYYNYDIVRDTSDLIDPFSAGSCLWKGPNWTGIHCWVDTLERINFMNQDSTTISIDFSLQPGDSAICYEYDNGDILMAYVDSIYWIEDDWIEDSCKAFRFKRSFSGIVIPDSVNETRIDISKNNGFIRCLDFYRFPEHLEPLFRVDLNYIVENHLPFRTEIGPGINSYRPHPQIGDSYYLFLNSISIGQGNFNSSSGAMSWEIMGVDTVAESNAIEVSINLSTADTASVNTYIYEPVMDSTIITLIHHDISNSDSIVSYFPRENRAAYRFISGEDGCPPSVFYTTCNYPIGIEIGIEPDSCHDISYTFTCHGGSEHIFRPYVGQIHFYEWLNDSGFINSHSRTYNYYRVWSEECGQYAWVNPSVEELDLDSWQFFPNPANQSFKIESIVAFDQLSVYNLQGQLVWKSESQLSSYFVDCSQWPNGIYVIRSVSDDRLQQQKLIVSH